MRKIGGNIVARIQLNAPTTNDIGERVANWFTVQTLNGFLDLANGDSKYSNFSAKIQESTHVFVCDFVTLDNRIKAENCRAVINDQTYDVMLIDNPMELNQQLEFLLKYTGGQNA